MSRGTTLRASISTKTVSSLFCLIGSPLTPQKVVASLSGPGGATLRTFDILNGHLLLEQRIHEPSHGQLYEPSYLGTFVAYAAEGSDLVVLSNGGLVQRLDNLGTVKWSWSSSDPRCVLPSNLSQGSRNEISPVPLSYSQRW